MTTLNETMVDTNCSPNSPSQGQKGITIWGPKPADIILPANSQPSAPIKFTCTKPGCWLQDHFCIVTYTVHTSQNSTNNTVGPINITFNGNTSVAAPTYHSKIGGHDNTESFDITQGSFAAVYNPNEENTIVFQNADPQVEVRIQGLQIVRGYGMNILGETCNPDDSDSGTSDFAVRHDYPCNYETCGG